VTHVLTAKLGPAKVRRATRGPARNIKERFDAMFRMAFADPHVWREGKYGPVFERFFAGRGREIARGHKRTLTLGPDAGRLFRSVQEASGQLKISVLIGAGGGPVTASVQALFFEKAIRTQGRGRTVIVSDGRYFLMPGKHGWTIQGFSVRRHDHRPRHRP